MKGTLTGRNRVEKKSREDRKAIIFVPKIQPFHCFSVTLRYGSPGDDSLN